MNKMTIIKANVFLGAAAAFVWAALIFLAVSFSVFDTNPSNWPETVRFFRRVFGLC